MSDRLERIAEYVHEQGVGAIMDILIELDDNQLAALDPTPEKHCECCGYLSFEHELDWNNHCPDCAQDIEDEEDARMREQLEEEDNE